MMFSYKHHMFVCAFDLKLTAIQVGKIINKHTLTFNYIIS